MGYHFSLIQTFVSLRSNIPKSSLLQKALLLHTVYTSIKCICSISSLLYGTRDTMCKLRCRAAVLFSLTVTRSEIPAVHFRFSFSRTCSQEPFSNISYDTFQIAPALRGSPSEAPCRACLRESGTEWSTTAESCQAIVMLKQPLHSSHCSTSTEPGLESYRPGAHDFSKGSQALR